MTKARVTGVAVAAALCGWLIGQFGGAVAHAQPFYDRLAVFAEVLGIIEGRYVTEVDESELIDAAIAGLVAELDPYTQYMDADAYRAMREETRGAYVGVGITIEPADGGVMVRQVFEGGPAARAGILEGDVIVEIDGEPLATAATDDAVQRLRGRRGESVWVTIRRDAGAQGALLSFEIVRDRITVDAVTSELVVPGVGLVRMRQFQADVGSSIRTAIDRLQAEHGDRLDAVVLDLRGNPGGLLSEAIVVADAFVDDGTIVSTGGRVDGQKRWSARRSTTRYSGPLVVLIDGMSASASEVVAGALRDLDRALLVGERTYGKGSVQSMVELRDGGALKITTSRYFTPSGASIHDVGIAPDIEVARDADASQLPVEAAGRDLSGLADAQLRAALYAVLTGEAPPGFAPGAGEGSGDE